MKQKIIGVFLILLIFIIPQVVFAYRESAIQVIPGKNIIRGETIEFGLLLVNESEMDHQLSLLKEKESEILSPILLQDRKIVSEIKVTAKSEQAITIQMNASKDLNVGNTVVPINFIDEMGTIYNYSLSLAVNNDYALEITNQISNATAISGKSFYIKIDVTNAGTLSQDEIRVDGDLPSKWVVESSTPQKINLNPGETGTLDLKIFVPSSQSSGKSNIEMTAISQYTSSDPLSISVAISTNKSFSIIAVLLIIAAASGTLIYFRKHGRR